MGVLQGIVVVIASSLLAVGVFTAAAVFVVPKAFENDVVRWLVTGKRLAPTRGNRLLMSFWAMLVGAYLLLSVGGYYIWSFFVLLVWLPVAVVVLKRSWRPVPKA